VQDRKGGGDATMAEFGAGFRTRLFDERVLLRAGVGYYDFSGAKGKPTFFDAQNGFGNTVDQKKDYVHDYNELDLGGEIETRLWGVPVSVTGQAVRNTAVQSDGRAWMTGIRAGKCEKVPSGSLLYEYRVAEKDAFVGVFTDSEFAGGGTDNRGHEVKIHVQVGKGARLGAAWTSAEMNLAKKLYYRRVQADLTVEF
jgi:hypothetical protein